MGIYLYYLPAYSPELNRIEAVFKQVKHHDIPVRSYTSKAELRQAVAEGDVEFQVRQSARATPRPAGVPARDRSDSGAGVLFPMLLD